MIEVWTGALEIPNQQILLEDVHLWSSHDSIYTQLTHGAALSLLAVVPTSHVPLHCIIAAPVILHTRSQLTQGWLLNALFDDPGTGPNPTPIDADASVRRQIRESEYGALFKIVRQEEESDQRSYATELFIYATSGLPQKRSADELDERSKSESLVRYATPDQIPDDVQMQIHAIAIDSRLYCQPQTTDLTNSTGNEKQKGPVESSNVDGKRKKLHEIFDEAAAQRKRHKYRHTDLLNGTKVCKTGSSIPATNLADALSFTSQPYDLEGCGSSQRQPQTSKSDRSDRLNGDNVSLHHTRVSISKRSSSSKSHLPLDMQSLVCRDTKETCLGTPDTLDSIQEQNKATLSKVVMTGMRMHGLQQNRKKAARVETARSISNAMPLQATSTPDNEASATTEDEFKSVYHQTFKAASFALRSSFSQVVVTPSHMQRTVEKLLDLFCLSQVGTSIGFTGPPVAIPVENSKQHASLHLNGKDSVAKPPAGSVVVTTP